MCWLFVVVALKRNSPKKKNSLRQRLEHRQTVLWCEEMCLTQNYMETIILFAQVMQRDDMVCVFACEKCNVTTSD